MEVEIRNYLESDWPEMQALIDSDWEKDHPLIHKELFDWQFNGYGELKDKKVFKVLLVDGKIEGFRGVIPGRYQYYHQGERHIVPGVSYAVWLVTEKLRGQGLGYRLLQAIEADAQVCVAIGSNMKTSVPIYRRNEYDFMESFHRWVKPLTAEGYQKLLSEEVSIAEIEKWMKNEEEAIPQGPVSISADALAGMWDEVTRNQDMLSLYRDQDFWNWRYIHSVGYEYLFFGSVEKGIVVARVEQVRSEDEAKNAFKVFRLIEVIPAKEKTFSGHSDQDINGVLNSALAWAKEQGCVAADYHCSSNRFKTIFSECNFREQNEEYLPEICSLAGMFDPYKEKPKVNNAHWKIHLEDGKLFRVDAEHTYFVKSDNDRDRPVVFPIR